MDKNVCGDIIRLGWKCRMKRKTYHMQNNNAQRKLGAYQKEEPERQKVHTH